MKKFFLKSGFGAAVFFLTIFLVINFVFADYDSLPEPLVGQLTVTQGDNTHYAGYTGNESVYNYNPNDLTGFVWNGMQNLEGCYKNGINLVNSRCFNLTSDSISSVIKEMTGRTFVDGVAGTEVAALYYPANSISGDAYTSGNNLNNFAFYGRNLNQSSDASLYGTGYTWGTANYVLNKEAQASYSDDQKAYYDNRITILNGEGKQLPVGGLAGKSWYLQNDNIASSTPSTTPSPEGRVWSMKPGKVILSGTNTYHGKGTIIINGNLTLSADASILPASDSDSLGIIVRGNLTFSGRNKTQMANFTSGSIVIAANYLDAAGSYVAKTFDIRSTSGVRFYYDYRLGSGWPPGFRYFNMPIANEQ